MLLKQLRRTIFLTLAAISVWPQTAEPLAAAPTFDDGILHAGASMVDVSPPEFPVRVNGMVEERTATTAFDTLMARALVLDDGRQRLAIVVVDSLMLPRTMLDDVKQQVQQLTGIPANHQLISATHTHSAPSAMPCLGSREDPAYVQFLPAQIVRSIVLASERLTPARVGWTVITDDQHNHCRRWIFRSDRMTMTDPFGQHNVRAHMHPGHQSPAHIGPSGPADTDLTLLSIQTSDGQPLAVLANYAMHYYGSPLVSGDFCGRFGLKLGELLAVSGQQSGFVGMMSQGTSGDSMWPDYSRAAHPPDLDAYTQSVAEKAFAALQSVEYHSSVTLAMAEASLKLNRRVPDDARLQWARETAATVGDRLPRGWPEVYAFEQLRLHEDPKAELKLQAIRIGDFGITAIPDEVYGITGIKLKQRSPLALTMNIELANGAEGYIPPPEQHSLGGYTTWPARTAGLEVDAEPKIVETLTKLLEEVADKPRRPIVDTDHSYSKAITASHPKAFWRLGDIEGTRAADSVGNHHGLYESGVAYYLPGPQGAGLTQQPRGNRCAHFAGGRVAARVAELGSIYSVECWVWNGLPNDARAVTGYFFSRGPDGDMTAAGDHLGIGGTYRNDGAAGRLLLFNGNEQDHVLVGRTILEPRTWNHVAYVRNNQHVTVYLNGNPQPEIEGVLMPTFPDMCEDIFLGGRNDHLFGLEGRLDECALYDRPLTPVEVSAHYAIASAIRIPQITESQPQPDSPPRSPAESMKLAHVREGFELQLVAAEPLVIDPVAIDWGPDGKLWVAEMADYPSGMDGQGQPGGRIRFLEDRDEDGRYETSTVLLNDVAFPTGVMAWGRGVLVTAAPEIFYAEDSDGDGKADLRRTLFSGFLEGNQQLRVNGLRWGLDNWVYCASGSHHAGYGADSQILSHVTGQKIAIGSRDFRFRPDTGEIEPQSGPSQFGRNRDAWGNWFGEQNSYPLWHYVLDDTDIRRNPHFAPPDPRHQVVTPANPPVYAAAPPEKRFHSFEQSGRFTSACSAVIDLDDLLFGSESADVQSPQIQHAFTCEPFSNLVQHNIVIGQGVSFRFERDPAESTIDFFASEDRWCRPVMVRTGPDGALWVVDMYRYMIEHPQWLPKEGQDELRPHFRSGDDRGRIYRIVPGGRPIRNVPRFDQLSPAELVRALSSPNGWQRDMAQRLLVSAGDLSCLTALEEFARTDPQPQTRLQALCTLEGLYSLNAETVAAALTDPHPGVRRQAVRLAPGWLEPTSLTPLVEDADAKVRLQLACSLGDYTDAVTGTTLGKLMLADADPFLRAAAMSSLNPHNIANVVNEVVQAMDNPVGHHGVDERLVNTLFGQVAAMADDPVIVRVLMVSAEPRGGQTQPWQMTALATTLDGLASRDWLATAHLSQAQQIQLARALAAARAVAVDGSANEVLRTASVALLLRQPEQLQEDLLLLQSLLVPQTPPQVQQAVARYLGRQSIPDIARVLLAGWPSHSPSLRSQILSTLTGREAWIGELVHQLEQGMVSSAEIDATLRQRLLATRDAAMRTRLENIFRLTTSPDRSAVIRAFQPVLQLSGDAVRGAIVFGKKCAACHKQGGFGHEVGPNLSSLTSKAPAALLESMLDPGAVVEAKYLNYVAVTTSGLSRTGLLATETGSSITLLAAEGKTESILRSEIEELRSTGKSLMPDGLEKDLSHQDLADLIEYVRAGSDR